jgi:hypothetical protein
MAGGLRLQFGCLESIAPGDDGIPGGAQVAHPVDLVGRCLQQAKRTQVEERDQERLGEATSSSSNRQQPLSSQEKRHSKASIL